MRKVGAVLTMSTEEVLVVASHVGTKSGKIKILFENGMDVKEIAAALDIRYNHVYNVLQNHIIVNEIEVVHEGRGTSAKRGEIEAMLRDGYKIIEVAKATKSVYNYVWKISQELNKKDKLEDYDFSQLAVHEVDLNELVEEEVKLEKVAKSRKKKGVQA